MLLRDRFAGRPTAVWFAAVWLLVGPVLVPHDGRAGSGRTCHGQRRVGFRSCVWRSRGRADNGCSAVGPPGAKLGKTISGSPTPEGAVGNKHRVPTVAKQSPRPASRASKKNWNDLFDGRSLQGWKITNFGGEGEVAVEDGRLTLDFGSPLTGVTYMGGFPTSNYEIRLDAQRVDGSDFFCALTFPVGESHCSFIAGGWGGGVIGLSSIDGRDASENETTDFMAFAPKKWYRIRVCVTDQRVRVWIDDQQKIDQAVAGHGFGTRPEVELSQPLGLASFDTRAAFRHVQFRRLRSTDE